MKSEDLRDPAWVLNHAAHELRGPLSTILGFAQLLQDNPREVEKLETYLGYIWEKALQMQGLLDGVLDLSRHELGKPIRMEVTPQPIAGVLTSLVPEIQKKYPGISVASQVQEATLFFDSRRLKALVSLVLDNACRFSGEAGTVELRGVLNKKQYIIEIQDRGPGIPEEHLGLVCEPFYAVDSLNGVGKGSGLGLALAKLYAELMGAQLAVHSQVGQGTRVTVTFTV